MKVENDCLFDFDFVAHKVNGKIFEVIVQEDHGPVMISLENILPDWNLEVAPYPWFIPAQGSEGGFEVSEVESASDP